MRKISKLLTFVLSVAMLCAFGSCTILDGDFVFVPNNGSFSEGSLDTSEGIEDGEQNESEETSRPDQSESTDTPELPEEPEQPEEVVSDIQVFTFGERTIENLKITVLGEGDAVTVKGAAQVTINSGTYDGGQTPFGGAGNTVVWVQEATAKVVINGGTFVCNGLATDEEGNLDVGHIDLIYCTAGTIEINGGFFKGADNTVWLLNCKDAGYKDGTAKIEVKGGTFVNWNPADNVSEGANTNFVADGYTVMAEEQESGDVWYTVVPVEETPAE